MKISCVLLNSGVAIAGLCMLKYDIDQFTVCIAIASASYVLGLLATDDNDK